MLMILRRGMQGYSGAAVWCGVRYIDNVCAISRHVLVYEAELNPKNDTRKLTGGSSATESTTRTNLIITTDCQTRPTR